MVLCGKSRLSVAEGNPDVTIETLHDDLTAGFADLKATLIAGFRSLPGREASEEMIRLLREGNRIQDERFAQLDLRIREQHLETQQVHEGKFWSYRDVAI